MKQFLTALIAVVVWGASMTVAAESTKIAVVSIQQAILKTEFSKQRIKQLEKEPEYAKARSQAEQLKSEGQALIKEIQKEGMTWSAEQQDSQRKKIGNKQADLEHLVRKLQAQDKELAQRLMIEMGPAVRKILDTMIKEDGIDLLLNDSTPQQVVLYASESINITDKLTDKLNQANSTN